MWHELLPQATCKLPVSPFKCLSVFLLHTCKYAGMEIWTIKIESSFYSLFYLKTAHGAHAPTEQFIYENAYLKVWQYHQMLRCPGVISTLPSVLNAMSTFSFPTLKKSKREIAMHRPLLLITLHPVLYMRAMQITFFLLLHFKSLQRF